MKWLVACSIALIAVTFFYLGSWVSSSNSTSQTIVKVANNMDAEIPYLKQRTVVKIEGIGLRELVCEGKELGNECRVLFSPVPLGPRAQTFPWG